MEQSPSEKLTVAQISNKFSAFYGTRFHKSSELDPILNHKSTNYEGFHNAVFFALPLLPPS